MKQSIVEKKEFDRTLKLIAKDSIIVFLSIFFTYEYRLIIARSFCPEIYDIFYLQSLLSNRLILKTYKSFNINILE